MTKLSDAVSTAQVDPGAAGMDATRLERITDHFRRHYIEPGKLAGCQILVARRGHLAYFRSLGGLEIERVRPVADDTIWRIYGSPALSVGRFDAGLN